MPNKEPAPFAKRMGCERPRISAHRRLKTFNITIACEEPAAKAALRRVG
jgi:hypothetical protein